MKQISNWILSVVPVAEAPEGEDSITAEQYCGIQCLKLNLQAPIMLSIWYQELEHPVPPPSWEKGGRIA